MCGIVGARHDWLLARAGDPATRIAAAVRTMRWRGRDGSGTTLLGGWWLGSARLAISGPDAQQPVVRRGGRFAGVLNGALVDARPLFDELLSKRSPPRPRPGAVLNDAWLPPLLLERGEQHRLRELRGHHAYAVVDAQRRHVILGQDRFAEKPLWCLLDRGGDGAPWRLAAFASTQDALRALGMPDAAPADAELGEWFRYGWRAPRARDVAPHLRLVTLPQRGLPVVASEDATEAWCHPLLASAPPARPTNVPLRDRMRDAVAACLDSPSPAALMLSGGLDSSCLALAAGELGSRVPAFQFCAEGAPLHERKAAAAVARRAGLPLRPVDAGPELLSDLPFLTACAGQPLGDPSVLAVHAVARTAAAAGVRILLGGEGADERLLGYARYRAVDMIAHLRKFEPAAWLMARILTGRRDDWSMQRRHRFARALRDDRPHRALLAVTPPAFGREVLAAHICEHITSDAPGHGSKDPTLAARDDDLRHYLPLDLLPKVDVATLAAGVEGRSPYLVADLDAFGADRRALGKRALRRAFRSDLPPEVLALPKHGFSLPLDDWFRRDLPCLDLLAEARSRQRPHLRPAGMARAIDMHRSGRVDIGHGIYLLLALETHLRALEDTTPTL